MLSKHLQNDKTFTHQEEKQINGICSLGKKYAGRP